MDSTPEDEPRRSRDPVITRNARIVALAVAGALAVAAIAVVLTRTPTTPGLAAPAANVTSAPPFRVHAPPPDRALVWLAVPSEQVSTSVRLRAVDWSGHVVGAEAFPCLGPCTYLASPDGLRVAVREQPADAHPVPPATVFTSDVRLVGSVTDSVTVWADDSRRLCTLHLTAAASGAPLASPPSELDLVDPAAHTTHVVADLPLVEPGNTGDGWQVLACSTTSDRVIAAVEDQAGVRAIRVLTLSTGRTVYTSDASVDPGCSCAIAALTVSHDGGVAIEALATGDANLVDLRTGATTRWRGRSSPTDMLTWNGRRTVTAVGHQAAPNAVAEVPSGRVTWHSDQAIVAVIAARPTADDLMLDVSTGMTSSRLVIVFADGVEIALPTYVSGA
jgi:hypothetical protein